MWSRQTPSISETSPDGTVANHDDPNAHEYLAGAISNDDGKTWARLPSLSVEHTDGLSATTDRGGLVHITMNAAKGYYYTALQGERWSALKGCSLRPNGQELQMTVMPASAAPSYAAGPLFATWVGTSGSAEDFWHLATYTALAHRCQK